jgi:glycosyltransferase involved in cell wall biosynthesis
MSVDTTPLVSCICVTNNRTEFLERAVACYQRQNYPNKELVVAFSAENIAASGLISKLNDSSIRALAFASASALTLGEKRNLAVEGASGFYFCVWDDDDWYHENRITAQVNALSGTQYKSSVLSNVILFDGKTNESYLSATRWAWEQTLLCERSVFGSPILRYQNLERGEDSPLVYNLKRQNLLLTVSQPELYIYVYHGENTFHRDHWEVNLLQWATKLTSEQSQVIQKIITSKSPVESSYELNHVFNS